MKTISKIQSVSDVITNSSSEVFLMSKGDAEYYDSLTETNNCIYIEKIDWDWLESNIHNWEMVCEFLDIDKKEISTYHEGSSWWGYWLIPEKEDWNTFLELHKKSIEEELIGLYFVEIEDHFADAGNVLDSARSDCMWSESRH